MTDASEREHYLTQARHHHGLVTRLTEDLDSRCAHHALRPGGPSAAWIVAHLFEETRTTHAAVFGDTEVGVATFQGSPDCRPEEALEAQWRLLRADWNAVSARMLGALEVVDPAALSEPPRIAVLPDFTSSLRRRVDFLRGHVFHVAWHLGQIGSIRADLGRGGGTAN